VIARRQQAGARQYRLAGEALDEDERELVRLAAR
jgi:hypothetical protein